jgi:hypothetical protein
MAGRQAVRLKRGDRVKFTMALPVFANEINFQFSLREGGRSVKGFSSYVSFRSGKDMDESPVLMVADPTTLMGTMASGWRRPILMSRSIYYGVPPATPPSGGPMLDFTLEPERLPENWLGFTSLRALLIGPTEWKQLTPAQQDAVMTWTASGGDLLLVDGIPETGFPIASEAFPSSPPVVPYFFGHVHALKSADITSTGLARTLTIAETATTLPDWALPAKRSRDWGYIQERGFRLPIQNAGIVSSRIYLSILVLFITLIGPVNYIYLWRKRLPVLMVFTVPLISACFILVLAFYGIVLQGFNVRARSVAFTILDQNLKQAATRSSISLYPGGSAGDGLHFPADLAVFPLGADGHGVRGSFSVDHSIDQQFPSGLLKPRAPINLETVGFRAARERLSFERDGDAFRVTNGLGGTIRELYYRENSRIYGLSGELTPGSKGSLKPATLVAADLYSERLKDTPLHTPKFQEVIEGQRNGTYLAVLETSPFWNSGVSSVDEHNSFHLVLGYGGQP